MLVRRMSHAIASESMLRLEEFHRTNGIRNYHNKHCGLAIAVIKLYKLWYIINIQLISIVQSDHFIIHVHWFVILLTHHMHMHMISVFGVLRTRQIWTFLPFVLYSLTTYLSQDHLSMCVIQNCECKWRIHQKNPEKWVIFFVYFVTSVRNSSYLNLEFNSFFTRHFYDTINFGTHTKNLRIYTLKSKFVTRWLFVRLCRENSGLYLDNLDRSHTNQIAM